jgi:hypothetical protein
MDGLVNPGDLEDIIFLKRRPKGIPMNRDSIEICDFWWLALIV